jgi:hypothetical protein
MIRIFKMLAGTLVVLFFMTGCQATTGETMGQNIDDGTLTSYVKTKLASDKLVSLTRVGVETNSPVKSKPASRNPAAALSRLR